MSLTNFQMVREFHEKFGLLINDKPTVPELKVVSLRKKLINEEHNELMEEMNPHINSGGHEEIHMANTAKELADLLYVCYGMAVSFGIDIDAVFAEVHSSNMSKLGDDGKPIYNEFGKVMKSKNYRQADVNKVLERAQ